MSSGLYLFIMLGVILLVTFISIPSLFRKKCPNCGTKNWIEADTCKKCGISIEEKE